MKATKRIILILSVLALLIGCFAFTSSAADPTETVNTYASKGTTSGSESISWKGTDVSVTIYKNGSSTGIRTTDTDHFRMYAKNKLVITTNNSSNKITKVVITCTTDAYATTLKGGISSLTSGFTAEGSGKVITITSTTSGASEFSLINSASSQTRISNIQITYVASCSHSNTKIVANNDGTHSSVCNDCKNVVSTTSCTAGSYEYADNSKHNVKCSICFGLIESAACIPVCEPNGDGETHSVKCDVCDEVLDTNVLCTDDGNGVCEECEGAITVKHVFEYESNGYRTHSVSCSHCDDSFDSEACVDEDEDTFCDYCEAFVAYVASFVTPDGITAPANVSGYTVTLPTLDDGANYKFAGWATEKVSKTETKPTLYNSDVTLTKDVTYYAVFSYTYQANVTVKTEGSWNLVTNASNLTVGDKIIIVASTASDALSTTQATNNRDAIAIEKPTDNTVTINNNVQIIILEAGTKDNTFAFYTDSGYLYAASSSSNHLKTQNSKDDNASWTISITDAGIATVKAQGTNTRNMLLYNTGSTLFACYSGLSTATKDICIYKYVEGEERVEPQDFTAYSSTIAKFSGANVNLGANLSVKYAVDTIYNLDDLKVVFTFGGEVLEPVSVEEGRFILKNIAPNQMGVNIKAELMLGEEVIATHDGYSVLESLENVKDTDAKTEELVEATLAYGDAASAYRNGETLTEDDRLEWVDNGNDVLEMEDENAYFKSFSVFFADVNKIRVKYNALPEGYKVYLEGTEIVGENGVIETDGILANELGNTFVFVIEDADGNTVATLECNVYAYCAMAKDSANVAMANLATVLNNYGALAANY